jgi:hypothetical protein
MGSGSDESIYWILTIVTTLSYHYLEIAITITHNQLTLQIQDCLERSLTTERLTDESHTHSFYMFSTDCIENTSPDVLLEGMFIGQLPSNKL